MRNHGGKFEGEGTYACTFTPPPQCLTPEEKLDTTQQVQTELAKIFSNNQSMYKEWDYAKKMHKVDPKQKFLIYPKSRCDVLRQEILKDPTAFQCSFLNKKGKGKKPTLYPMLTMAYGGKALDSYVESGLPAKDLINILIDVLKGMRLLARHKLVHHDLKFNNILYDVQTEKTKIIDFGLTIGMSDVFNMRKNGFLNSKYWLHPPEMRLTSLVAKKQPVLKELAREHFKKEIELLNIYFSNDHPTALKDIIMQDMYTYCDYEADYIKYVMRVSKKDDPIAYMTKYANKIDLYSLGISMIHLSQYAWYDTLEQRSRFMKVIAALINPDPTKRPSIGKTITMLENAI